LTNTDKTEDQTRTPKFGHTGSSVLSFLAVTEHIHAVTGMPEVQVNDPSLPFLAKLTDDVLAYEQTRPIAIPPEGWTEESHDYDHFVEVKPGDPRYPGPDTPHMPGALSPREVAASWAWTQFGYAMNYLEVLAQYFPDLTQENV